MVHLNYRDTRPIYTQIADTYRQQITAGILQQGDKLPSVRELAGELAINPNTIQRAYRELEVQGWIASVPGKGSFVCGCPRSPEQHQLWTEFDHTVAQLLSAGVSKEALLRRLQEGGDRHA